MAPDDNDDLTYEDLGMTPTGDWMVEGDLTDEGIPWHPDDGREAD